MLFLFVNSNLYIAIYVCGVPSWTMLPTPFPALPDTCVQKLGDVAANAGRTCLQMEQLGEESLKPYRICLFAFFK